MSAYGLASFKHNDHAITLPEGFDYASLKGREVWANVAPRMKVGDIIHIRNAENTIYARYIVRAADKFYVDVAELESFDFAMPADEATDENRGLTVAFRGRAKWAVVRTSDNERIKDGFDTAEDARAWMTGASPKKAA